MKNNPMNRMFFERPGFTDAEILRDAAKIVAYGIKKGWVIKPVYTKPITDWKVQWIKENQP